MSILNKITKGRVPRAQKVVIYAPEGFGKSTMASRFPGALFLDVEESTAQMDVARIGREDLPTLKDVEQALAAVSKERACQTLIIDTMDWLESMALEAIIKDAGSDKIQGIEDFGFGKGYTILRERITLLLAKFDAVIQSGINVVLLAHSKVAKFEPPDGAGAYDRYELKLSKQVAPLIKEWADMLLFGNFRTQIKERDKHESGAQYKGIGGKERVMYCVRAAAWDAKNRHEMKDSDKWDIAVIEAAFRAVGAPWENSAVGPVPSTPPAQSSAVPGKSARNAGGESGSVSAESTPGKSAAGVESQPPAMITTSHSNGVADPIPGIDAPEPKDEELSRIVGAHADAVNHYLVSQGRITVHQSYLSVKPDFRERIMKNPAGFLKAALAAFERRAA